MGLLDSQFVKNLEAGELPVLKVEIQKTSIISFSIAILVVAVIIILVLYLTKIKS